MTGTGDNHIPRLHLAVESAADRCTVMLTGELDLLTGPVLLRMLDTTTGAIRHLSLDVAQLGFCDIAGLRALLKVQQVAHERGVRLTLCNPSTHLLWLLRVTGASGQLLGATTTGDAVAGDDDEPPPVPPGPAESGSERDWNAGDRALLDQERSRLLDERAQRLGERQRWEDIREDLADIRERDLDQRDAADAEPPRRDGQREP